MKRVQPSSMEATKPPVEAHARRLERQHLRRGLKRDAPALTPRLEDGQSLHAGGARDEQGSAVAYDLPALVKPSVAQVTATPAS